MTKADQSKKKSSGTGLGCGVLFLTPFAGVAVVMGWFYVTTLIDIVDSGNWVEVPAWIEDTRLISDIDSDSTTYRTTANYRYEYRGVTYHGTRVSFSKGSDNIGSFHQDIHAELSKHMNERTAFRCYVNPDAPSESILYRTIRVSMLIFYSIFILAFGTVGIGGLSHVLSLISLNRRVRSQALIYPDAPWLWNPEHADGRFKPKSPKGLLYFSIVFNLLAWGPFLAAPTQMLQSLPTQLFALAPVTGFALFWYASAQFRQRLKYGVVQLRIEPWPYSPGERLIGYLEFPGALPYFSELQVKLVVTSSQPAMKTSQTLFDESRTITAGDMSTAFEFSPPGSLPFSTSQSQFPMTSHALQTDTVVWIIEVSGADGSQGKVFHTTYEIATFPQRTA
ncbi:MAG: DUF3592 domain-containing protein [Planctomyces sp.]|nr:DUF3592 domain-containing protein [Planctomyces sp.]